MEVCESIIASVLPKKAELRLRHITIITFFNLIATAAFRVESYDFLDQKLFSNYVSKLKDKKR
jgi:hypothetical protein